MASFASNVAQLPGAADRLVEGDHGKFDQEFLLDIPVSNVRVGLPRHGSRGASQAGQPGGVRSLALPPAQFSQREAGSIGVQVHDAKARTAIRPRISASPNHDLQHFDLI